MEKKTILIVLFILIYALTFVNSQDAEQTPPANNDNKDPEGGDGGNGDNGNGNGNGNGGEVKTPAPVPTTTTTTTTNPAKVTVATTIPQEIITTTKAPEPINITTKQIGNISMIIKTSSQKPMTTKVLANTTPVAAAKKTALVKQYPQQTFVGIYDKDDSDNGVNNGNFIMYFIYIAGGLVSTILIGFATFTLYNKGFGDEAPSSSRAWDNSYEDDGYRNKSTISRNTLTPSIRNTTLGSPSSNPNTSQYH